MSGRYAQATGQGSSSTLRGQPEHPTRRSHRWAGATNHSNGQIVLLRRSGSLSFETTCNDTGRHRPRLVPAERAGTAPSRMSRIRNNRRTWVSTFRRTWCTGRNRCRHRAAWSRHGLRGRTGRSNPISSSVRSKVLTPSWGNSRSIEVIACTRAADTRATHPEQGHRPGRSARGAKGESQRA